MYDTLICKSFDIIPIIYDYNFQSSNEYVMLFGNEYYYDYYFIL